MFNNKSIRFYKKYNKLHGSGGSNCWQCLQFIHLTVLKSIFSHLYRCMAIILADPTQLHQQDVHSPVNTHWIQLLKCIHNIYPIFDLIIRADSILYILYVCSPVFPSNINPPATHVSTAGSERDGAVWERDRRRDKWSAASFGNRLKAKPRCDDD